MQNVFQFQTNKPVRVEYKDGEPLFCLADIADVLEIQNPRQLKLKEKGVCKIYTPTNSGKQELLFIDEFNLYRVIFRSNKPEAVKFQDWIFEEVIPTIRQTGSYILNHPYNQPLDDYEAEQLRAAVKVRCERTGETTQAVYIKLHAFMQVNSYLEIRSCDFVHAVNFLASMENAPALFREPQTAVDGQTLLSIGRVLLNAQKIRLFVERYLSAFENLGIDNSGELYSYVHDTEPAFENVRSFFIGQCAQHAAPDMEQIHRRILQTV